MQFFLRMWTSKLFWTVLTALVGALSGAATGAITWSVAVATFLGSLMVLFTGDKVDKVRTAVEANTTAVKSSSSANINAVNRQK